MRANSTIAAAPTASLLRSRTLRFDRKRIRTRADGFVIEIAAQILSEGLDRVMALGRRLLQGLEDDIVEIAFERARDAAERCGRSLAPSADRLAWLGAVLDPYRRWRAFARAECAGRQPSGCCPVSRT